MRAAILTIVSTALALAGESEDERLFALSTGILRNIESGSPALPDRQINDYVTGLARTLSANCAAGQALNVRIFVDGERNAMALPARVLIVHSALLGSTRSEAALAGALAQVFFQSLRLRPVVSDGATIRTFWMPTAEGSPYLLRGLPFLPDSVISDVQSSITSADSEAARCLVDAGYDPRELLADLQSQSIASKFHSERVRSLEALLASSPASGDAIVSSSAFTAMQIRLRNLTGMRAAPSLRVVRAR